MFQYSGPIQQTYTKKHNLQVFLDKEMQEKKTTNYFYAVRIKSIFQITLLPKHVVSSIQT